jgi:CubicO group peptidase (beta-lactamase class C family)
VLYEKGLLDLDAPIQKYVPEFPEKDAPITSRLLAGHLSGIRHYNRGEINSTREYPSLRAALSIFATDPLRNPPGDAYSYSTYAYTLLGAAMEAAAGSDFATLMREHLFEPLAMRGAAADLSTPLIPHRARPYVYDSRQRPVNAPLTDHSYKLPGGGIVATAEDLARFGSALLAPGFLKAETLATLFEPMKTNDGASTRYAMGWSIGRDWSDRRTIGHGGNQPGGRSHLLIYPEQRIVIALLTNIASAPFGQDGVQVIADPFLEARGAQAPQQAAIDPSGVYELAATSGEKAAARVEIWPAGDGWGGSIATSDAKHGRLASIVVQGDRVRAVVVGHRALFALQFALKQDQVTGDVNVGSRKVALAGRRTPLATHADVAARAAVHYAAQRWPQAAEAYAQVVRDQPDHGEAHFRLAYALLLSGRDYERAARACERAAELDYQKPVSLFNAACAYSRLKQLDRAFAFLRKSLDAGFDQPEALETDPDLENMRADPRFGEILKGRR